MSEADLGALLKRTGICTSETFSAEGLLKAAELFKLAAPFALRAERGGGVASIFVFEILGLAWFRPEG